MKIGQLAALTGVSRDTIRLYESREMLTNITRPYEWNNYKDYGDENIKRIQIIKYLQRFSFTLKECKTLLDARDKSINGCIDKSKAFVEKLDKIEKEIAELLAVKQALIQLLSEERKK